MNERKARAGGEEEERKGGVAAAAVEWPTADRRVQLAL